MEILAHHLETVSAFGDSIMMLFLGFSLVILFLMRQNHYKTAMVTALTSMSYVYSFYLKNLFGILRPETADPQHFYSFDVFSFPSSHVLFYTVFWGFVVYLTFKYTEEAKLLLHIVRVVAFYMILSVGASRVFLGVHTVKDIVAGYIFGLFSLGLLVWLDKKLEEMIPEYYQK